MFILGVVVLLCGVANGVQGSKALANSPQFEQIQKACAQLNTTTDQLMWITAVITMIPGVLFLIFGVWVRRGGRAAVICSLILSFLGALGLLLQILGGVLAMNVFAICAGLVLLALASVTIVWLFQASRDARTLAFARQQHQGQYWQSQQQQMAYNQGAPGSAFPPQQPMQQMPPQSPPPGYGAPGPVNYGYGYGASPPAAAPPEQKGPGNQAPPQ